MAEQHQACEQRERPVNVDLRYRNDSTFLGDGPETQRFMVATMVLVTIVWLANVVWFIDSASHGAGLPYETWWQHWLLIAFAAIPVYAAIGQLHRQTRSTQSRFLRLVVFLVPPIAAVHLIGIAGKCVSLNGLASYSCSPVGCGCPENASFLGWGGLYAGFAVLVATTVYVLLADRARLR